MFKLRNLIRFREIHAYMEFNAFIGAALKSEIQHNWTSSPIDFIKFPLLSKCHNEDINELCNTPVVHRCFLLPSSDSSGGQRGLRILRGKKKICILGKTSNVNAKLKWLQHWTVIMLYIVVIWLLSTYLGCVK